MIPPFVSRNEPLAPRTTIGVGGSAALFATCRSEDDVQRALAFAREHGHPVDVFGGGSNVVVADEGIDGLVLHPAIRTLEQQGRVWRVGAGIEWDAFVGRTVEAGHGGVECLSGIPGLVGAAPMQNIGAYGQEVASTITRVRCVDRSSGDDVEFVAAECGFGYRDSHFKSAWRDRFVVVAVEFALESAEFGDTTYAGVAEHLVTADAPPTLANVRHAVVAVRRAKSMVVDTADPNSRSCGSFFTNPIVSVPTADAVADRRPDTTMPRYPAGDRVKIPAAWLIEQSGFSKGTTAGRVGLSEHHTLAIVNRGGGSAADVAAFAAHIRDTVDEVFGVRLTPEPVPFGPIADRRAWTR